eukprot:149204-Alexandrium_andersonii.AAC.1
MSASLVGSEMCIRDSHYACARIRRAHSAEDCPLLPAFRKANNSRGHAVSYTHLTLPTICSV